MIDSAKSFGIIPVSGKIEGKGNYAAGAVFYGVQSNDPALAEVYAQALKKLKTRCATSAVRSNRRIVKINKLDPEHQNFDRNKISFRGIKITLPSEFISADPEKVNVQFELAAEVKLVQKKGIK